MSSDFVLGEFFYDDAWTGRHGTDPSFRGRATRALFAARIDAREDLAWALRLAGEIRQPIFSLKSEQVLVAASESPRIGAILMNGVASSTIYVHDMVADIEALDLPNAREVALSVARLAHGVESDLPTRLGSLASFIRDVFIEGTPHGEARRLVEDVEVSFGLPRRQLSGWPGVGSMPLKDQDHYLLRASADLADVVDPTVGERAARAEGEEFRCIHPGRVLARVIRDATRGDRVFDGGNATVLGHLGAAHRIAQGVGAGYLQDWRSMSVVRAATDALLPIRVADWSAGVARSLYEGCPNSRSDGVRRVQRHFSRVFLNDRWLPRGDSSTQTQRLPTLVSSVTPPPRTQRDQTGASVPCASH